MWQELIFEICYFENIFETYKKCEITPRELFQFLNSTCESFEKEPRKYENILSQIYHFVKSQVVEQFKFQNSEIISNFKWHLCILRKVSKFTEEKNKSFLYDIFLKFSKTGKIESEMKIQFICVVFEELAMYRNFKMEEEITVVETMVSFLYTLKQNDFSSLQPSLEKFFNNSVNIQGLSDKFWSETISMILETKTSYELEKVMLHLSRMSEMFMKNFQKCFIKSLFLYYNDAFEVFILSALVHTDTLTRKRAISFVNFFVFQSQNFEYSESAVFHKNLLCSFAITSSTTFWLSFIEMLTTLEETQYHIIKPVVISFQKSLASINKANINPLWLLTLAIRMVKHNCKIVSKKGVVIFLQIILYYDSLYSSSLNTDNVENKTPSANNQQFPNTSELYLELCLNFFVEKLFPLLSNANFFYKKMSNEFKNNEEESVDVAENLNDFFTSLQCNAKLMALFTKKFLTAIKEAQKIPAVVECIFLKAFTFYFHDADKKKKSIMLLPYSESSALFRKSYYREEIEIVLRAYVLEILQMITNQGITQKNLIEHPCEYINSMQYFSHIKRNQKIKKKIDIETVTIFLDEDLERYYIETFGAFQRNHLKLDANSVLSSCQQDELYEDLKADLDSLTFTEDYTNFPVLNPLDHRLSTHYKSNVLFMKFLVSYNNHKNAFDYLLGVLKKVSNSALLTQIITFVIDLMTKFYEYTVFCAPTDDHNRAIESCFELCECISSMLITHLPGEKFNQNYENILDTFLAFLPLVDAFVSLESNRTKFKKLKDELENHARLLKVSLLNAIIEFDAQSTEKIEYFEENDFFKFESINSKLIFLWIVACSKKYNTEVLTEENRSKRRLILTQIMEYIRKYEILWENHPSIVFQLLNSDISSKEKCHLLEKSDSLSFEHQLLSVYTVLKSENKKSKQEICPQLEESILKNLYQMLSSALKTIKYMYIFSNDLCFLITQVTNQRFCLTKNMIIFFAKAVTECITHEFAIDDLSRLKAELLTDYYITRLDVPLKEYFNETSIPRARLLFFVSQFDSNKKCELVSAILDQLVNQYKVTLECKKRCYGNSQMHKLKQRLISAIFLFEFTDGFSTYFPMFLEALSKESQPSVRFISIIIITRMLSCTHQHDHMLMQVFKAFEEASMDSSTKPSHLISLILLTVYFLKAWIKKVVSDKKSVSEVQKECAAKGILSLIFLTSTPHSLTRVHAQTSILALSSQAVAFVGSVEGTNVAKTCVNKSGEDWCANLLNHVEEEGVSTNNDKKFDIEHFSGFKDVVEAMKTLIMFSNFFKSTKNSYKLAHNCCESFMMRVDPFTDTSFELIFHMLPLYFGMSSDEAISPSLFDHSYNIYPSLSCSRLALFLSPERKSLLVNAMCSSSWKETNEDPKKLNDPDDDDEEDVGHFQKKIITHKTSEDGKKHSLRGGNDIMLVASLVDSAANLGGLCRTCEILGVDRMLVRDRKVINSSDFESLSVTANKWIQIDELPLKDLEDFFRSRKKSGWSLIGLEQTSKSEPLQSFTFPQKCIILLGNERSGIPVNLIQLMDKCLEIPQVGVVRSLNVHVSGALVLWECLKQRINNAEKKD